MAGASIQSAKSVVRLMATLWGREAKSQVAKVDPSRLQPMIYPYTITAGMIHFPWIFFFKQCWWPRYLIYANILCYPLWVYIHFKVNSPEAKLAWENKKKLDFKKEHLKEWEVLD